LLLDACQLFTPLSALCQYNTSSHRSFSLMRR
jgi:hypothetical protein